MIWLPYYTINDWETWGRGWELIDGVPWTDMIDNSDTSERSRRIKTMVGMRIVPRYTAADLRLWGGGWVLKNGIPFRKSVKP